MLTFLKDLCARSLWAKHYREGRAIFTRDDLTVDVPVSILDELVKGR